MLILIVFACTEVSPVLPESHLPTISVIHAVQYSNLRGLIHKPNPLPSNGKIYTAAVPLASHKDCFASQLSNDVVSFLTTNEQLQQAQEYLQGIVIGNEITSQSLDCQ